MSGRGTRWLHGGPVHHEDPSYPLVETITAERLVGVSHVGRRLMGLLRSLLSSGCDSQLRVRAKTTL